MHAVEIDGSNENKDNIKLFRVRSLASEYGDHLNVRITWFHPGERKNPRPYAKLINDYQLGHVYARFAIDELFDGIEAAQLKRYLDRQHGSHCETWIEEVELPIEPDRIGISGMPTGGGICNYELYREDTYDLPFEAVGYVDLRRCERRDGRKNDFTLTLTKVNGNFRLERQ